MTLYVRRTSSAVWHWRRECRLQPAPQEWYPNDALDWIITRRQRPTCGTLCHWCGRIEAREDREIAARKARRKRA